MNSLTQYFLDNEFDTEAIESAMRCLMDAGLISDEAIIPGDVAEVDAVRAVEYLEENLCE